MERDYDDSDWDEDDDDIVAALIDSEEGKHKHRHRHHRRVEQIEITQELPEKDKKIDADNMSMSELMQSVKNRNE